MKQEINVFDYAGKIGEALPRGILVTTKAGEKVNSMTIGWGTVGIEWGRPIFTAFIRDSRFTREMLDQNGEFTVNVPLGEVDSSILVYCGRNSGRDVDKISHLGLHLEEPEKISVPGIKELPLTLECRVLCRQKQDPTVLPQEIQDRYYPANAEGVQDFHYAYYAEIVAAYRITD